MKNQKIQLNDQLGFDTLKILESRAVFLANSGGGKSYAIRKFAEGACEQVQTIIIDPEGEFASLREKYDFILAGKNADVPVEVRSAALLATRLLEIGKSAVIDLYELHPQERQHYVKLFAEAMINAPKELYHPVFIILDEAHEYAPEGKPSEATYAVEALASKGRKRGYCLIPATQRISKLSKNISAECNNKLIGRASQDIDMKRAGDELGFTKERLKELRQLKPGEFFAFGPAISDEVIKIKIGAVRTTHAKVGYKGTMKTPPPSNVIKKVLGELADLPHEAEKEAKTAAELKVQLATARKEITRLAKQPVPESIPIGVSQWMQYGQTRGYADYFQKKIAKEVADEKNQEINAIKKVHAQNVKFIEVAYKKFQQIIEIAGSMKIHDDEKMSIRTIPMQYSTTQKRPIVKELMISNMDLPPQKEIDTVHFPPPIKNNSTKPLPPHTDTPGALMDPQPILEDQNLTGPEQRILDAIAWANSIGIEKPENSILAFLSGYTNPKSTSYTNPRGSLIVKGLVSYPVPGSVALTPSGASIANSPDMPGDEHEFHNRIIARLTGPQARLMGLLFERRGDPISNDDLAVQAGYSNPKSTSYTNPRGELKSFGLIHYPTPGMVAALPLLFIN